MNVHLSFLKVIPSYFLISIVFLTFLAGTPGMYLMGLRIVGTRSPSFGSAVRRALGNILTLGFGIIFSGWRSSGRTFGDVLSLSQVLPVSQIKFGFGMAVDFESVVKPSAPVVGTAQKLAAGVLDILIIASINGVVLYALDRVHSSGRQIVEVEDFSVNRGWVDPSWRASGFAESNWHSPWIAEFKHVYRGAPGVFDILLNFSNYYTDSKYLEVESAGQRSKFIFDEPSKLRRTMPVLHAVELSDRDVITLRLGGFQWSLDYLELRPFRVSSFVHMDYTPVTDAWLDGLGIGGATIGFTLLLCLTLFPCYWVLLVGIFGMTWGSFLVGFAVRDVGSMLPPGIVRAWFLLVESLIRTTLDLVNFFWGWSNEYDNTLERVEFYYL